MIDEREREIAAQIERHRPQWLVMWGCYSRLFWAFPRFQATEGTIVSARDPDSLLEETYRIEEHVVRQQRMGSWRDGLPRRRPDRQPRAAPHPQSALAAGAPLAASPGELVGQTRQAPSGRSLPASVMMTAQQDAGSTGTPRDQHGPEPDIRGRLPRLWRIRGSR